MPVIYPEIEGNLADVNLIKINDLLERLPEHEFYAHNCDTENPQLVSGNFKVLLKTDSILSIEFQTDIKYQNEQREIFHALVINPNKDASVDISLIGLDPADLIPNFDRIKILPYIEKYNSEHKVNINTLAYQSGSNYVITWGISKSYFIIYPGGEGEFFGYDKIEIPLNELK